MMTLISFIICKLKANLDTCRNIILFVILADFPPKSTIKWASKQVLMTKSSKLFHRTPLF